MHFVIAVARKIVSAADLHLPPSVEWTEFVDYELDSANQRDHFQLGGLARPSNNLSDDEDIADNAIEINMDNIMARFNSYTQKVTRANALLYQLDGSLNGDLSDE